MGTLSTIQALVFIIKAFIETFRFLTGKIESHKYHASMDDMRASLDKASNGKLTGRLEGGSEVEDQINQHAPGGKS